MKAFSRLLILVPILFFISVIYTCTHRPSFQTYLPAYQKVLSEEDSLTWKSDAGGCKGERLKLAGKLDTEFLLYLRREDIVKILGQPDQVTTSNHYTYNIEGCNSEPGTTLELYFDKNQIVGKAGFREG